MKKEIYYCDVCGREVEEYADMHDITLSDGFQTFQTKEVCRECFVKAETKFIKLAKFIGLDKDAKLYVNWLNKQYGLSFMEEQCPQQEH